MLFSEKENVFMCLVAFQKMFRKIFSGIWLCSWKYHRKHIFYLLLTFSHIFLVAKRIYNIIHSSIQKHKQNPEKKSSNLVTFSRLPNKYIISFILQYRNTNKTQKKKSSNLVKLREEGTERDNWVRWGAAIGAALCEIATDASWDCDWRSQDCDRCGASRDRDRQRNLSPFARLWAPLFARLNSRSDLKVK